MPRVSTPSAKEIGERPREYALLRQVEDAKGDVDAKVLAEYQKSFGVAGKEVSGDKLSFEEFAALFAKAPTHTVDGEGNCVGFAMDGAEAKFKPLRFVRRSTGDDDIRIQITHAGVCHSDIHTARNEWHNAIYPVLPGHEIAGIVTEVGKNVKAFKVGDRAGVGCLVNACGTCEQCLKHNEQFCAGQVFTYNTKDRDESITRGGYSTFVVVNRNFVLRMPENLPLGASVPLLCAGITVYSPLRYYGLDKKGLKIGIVGLGGLGHMGIKYAKAFGADVTVISTSEGKRDEAIKVLGAQHFLISKNEEEMKAQAGTFDGILDTVSAKHDLIAGLNLLKPNGKYVCVGAPPEPSTVPTVMLLMKRLTLAGSLIGGIKETQEMLDFSAEHNITCMTETIPIDKLDEAYDRVVKSDVRYRFVIDIQGSLVQ